MISSKRKRPSCREARPDHHRPWAIRDFSLAKLYPGQRGRGPLVQMKTGLPKGQPCGVRSPLSRCGGVSLRVDGAAEHQAKRLKLARVKPG